MAKKQVKVYFGDDKACYIQKSKWLHLEYMEVTRASWMYEYSDERIGDKKQVTVFRCKGKTYCIEQFERASYPITIKENGDIVAILSGYDSTAGLDPEPLFIELDDGGEYVRLWKYVGDMVIGERMDELMEKFRARGYKVNQPDMCAACLHKDNCHKECLG